MNEEYKKLINDGKGYLKTQYDLLRLELLDKLSLILGLLVFVIVALFLLLGALAYFSVALIGWLVTCMPMSIACCVLGGVLLLILVVLFCMRQRWFIDPFIKLLASRLFPAKSNDDMINNQQDETVA